MTVDKIKNFKTSSEKWLKDFWDSGQILVLFPQLRLFSLRHSSSFVSRTSCFVLCRWKSLGKELTQTMSAINTATYIDHFAVRESVSTRSANLRSSWASRQEKKRKEKQWEKGKTPWREREKKRERERERQREKERKKKIDRG